MADEKKEETETGEGGSKFKFFENKAIVLGAIVVVQIVLAIGLTQFLIVPKLGVSDADLGTATPEIEEMAMPEMGVLVGLQEIIVTLKSDPKRPRYLKIDINLEVSDGLVAEVVSGRLPQLRDMVIMALSDKSAEDLSSPEGKKGLRDEIFRKIDSKMPAGALMNVYFSDLVVQ